MSKNVMRPGQLRCWNTSFSDEPFVVVSTTDDTMCNLYTNRFTIVPWDRRTYFDNNIITLEADT